MSSSGVSADATTSSVARSTATTLPSYPSTCSTRPDMAPTLPASLVDIGPDTRRCPSRARPSAKETLPARSSPNLPEAPCPGRTRRPEAGRGKGAKRGGRGFRRVSRLGRRRTSAGPAESGRDLGEHGPSAPMEALLMKSLRTPTGFLHTAEVRGSSPLSPTDVVFSFKLHDVGVVENVSNQSEPTAEGVFRRGSESGVSARGGPSSPVVALAR